MLEYIYNHSPIIIQNIMVSIQGKIFEKQRYTNHYFEEIKRLRECDDFFELQNQRFNEFYEYIKENSEFYLEKIEKNNLSNEKITVDNIDRLPEITKDDIRKNIDKIITTKKNKLIKMGTGGSTGKSMIFYTNAYDMSRKIAYLDYFKEQHGVYKGMKRVSVGGRKIVPINQKRKIFWRFNKPLNQLMISAYHADGDNL